MEIRVDTSEIERANKAVQVGVYRLTGRGQQRRVMRGAGNLLRDMIQNRLHSKKVGPAGERWPAWSPNYKAPKHGGHTLLVLSGKMARQVRATRGTRQIAVGTSVVYGNVHNFGHTFTNAFGKGITVRIPKRPFSGWGPDEKSGVTSTFETWMGAAFKWR